MELEMRIRFDKGELHEARNVVEAIDEVVTVPIEQLGLEPIEEVVLRAVREDSGAARKIHRNAAEYDECPVDWVDGNGPEREAIKKALHRLDDKGLVELKERTWYPAD